MELAGAVLFAAHRNFGVELIDVSDPRPIPNISASFEPEKPNPWYRAMAFSAGVWASSELVVVDARNPRQPTITARCPLDGYGDGVDVVGNFVSWPRDITPEASPQGTCWRSRIRCGPWIGGLPSR